MSYSRLRAIINITSPIAQFGLKDGEFWFEVQDTGVVEEDVIRDWLSSVDSYSKPIEFPEQGDPDGNLTEDEKVDYILSTASEMGDVHRLKEIDSPIDL